MFTAGEEADACQDGHCATGTASRLKLRVRAMPLGTEVQAVVSFGPVTLGRSVGGSRHQATLCRLAWERAESQLQEALRSLRERQRQDA